MLYFIYFISLFIFPIILSILLDFVIDKDKIDESRDDIRYICGIIVEIVWIFTIIYFMKFILIGATPNENNIKIMFLNVLYFVFLFSQIIFINYFSTQYFKFRICMRTFLDELVKFVQNNFILNLLFFTLLIFVKKNNDLTMGLVGSYFFFSLTTIHHEYKENININNKNFKFVYKMMQFILNILILMEFIGIEKIISQYAQNQAIGIEFSYTIYSLILGGVICVNAFLPQIEHFCKRLNIAKKEKL